HAGGLLLEDGEYGTVRVRAWTGLHPKTPGQHAQRDARGRRPIVRGTLLLLVEVSRLPQQTRQPQALWLWWQTPDDPDSVPNLDRAWRASVRRFHVEQPVSFLRPPLNQARPLRTIPHTA